MTNDSFHTYTYDALNRRTQSREGSANAVDYSFNLSGQRNSSCDATTHALIEAKTYWGSTPVEYYSSSGAHFEHQDYLGTERMRTSSSGAVEGTFQSLSFGDGFTTTGTDTDASTSLTRSRCVLDHRPCPIPPILPHPGPMALPDRIPSFRPVKHDQQTNPRTIGCYPTRTLKSG